LTAVTDDEERALAGWSPKHLRSTAGASRIRLRRARYGDASIVELTADAVVTASVQTTLTDDKSVERLRVELVDRSSTFHASDDDTEIDFKVVDSDVLRGSSFDFSGEALVVSLRSWLLFSPDSLALATSPDESSENLLMGTGTGIGSGSGSGIGIGYGTSMAVGGGTSPAGGQPAAPKPSGIDAAAANDDGGGGLTWVGGNPAGECGHRALVKNPR